MWLFKMFPVCPLCGEFMVPVVSKQDIGQTRVICTRGFYWGLIRFKHGCRSALTLDTGEDNEQS